MTKETTEELNKKRKPAFGKRRFEKQDRTQDTDEDTLSKYHFLPYFCYSPNQSVFETH